MKAHNIPALDDPFSTEFLKNLKLVPMVDEKQETEVIITLTARGKNARTVTTLDELPQRLRRTGETLSKVLEFKRPEKEARHDIPSTGDPVTYACPECNQEAAPGWTYCPFCWTVLPQPAPASAPVSAASIDYSTFKGTRHCSQCKEIVHKDMTYCPYCWTELD